MLGDVFGAKADAFRHVVKLGRTCWQDSLQHTLGEEFGGYAALMRRLAVPCFRGALRSAWAGTGLGADPGYMDALYRHLSDIYGEEVRPTASLFDGLQNGDFFVTVSGFVKEVATSSSKIVKDLRLMSRGPRSGFMEIRLPALSPGSSIMPGKINPTVPEMVIQIAHYCEEHGVTVKEAVLAIGLLNEADADRLIDPILMTNREAMARAIAEFRARIDG